MMLRFWGVRGSIAYPGPSTVEFGGNTPCLELRFSEKNRLIIIDAGTGIHPLGNRLVSEDIKKGPISAEIFITHTHWDHIIGFPFFRPIYIPGMKLKVYGPITFEDDSLEKVMGDLLRYRYRFKGFTDPRQQHVKVKMFFIHYPLMGIDPRQKQQGPYQPGHLSQFVLDIVEPLTLLGYCFFLIAPDHFQVGLNYRQRVAQLMRSVSQKIFLLPPGLLDRLDSPAGYKNTATQRQNHKSAADHCQRNYQ